MKRATLVCAVLAAAGTGAVIWQQRSLAELRRPDQPAGFTRAATTDNTNVADERELIALREETKDLPRLRNEVTQLRAYKAELDTARRGHEQLTEAKRTGASVPREAPSGFISKEQLKNAGFTTPEGAVETFFWAMRESHLDLMVQCLSPDHRDRRAFEGLPAETRAQQISGFKNEAIGLPRISNFSDFTIAERQQISDDTVVLSLRSSTGAKAAKYRLKRIGAEWKIEDLPL